MTTGSRISSTRSSRRPARLFAAEVAAEYAAATAAAEDTQEEILWVTMEIGEHLAERGHACEWHQIDGEVLGRFTLTGELDDRVSFLRLAAPMLVWLAETARIDGERVRAILEAIAKGVSKCPRSKKLVKRQLDRLSATMVAIENVDEDADTLEVLLDEDTEVFPSPSAAAIASPERPPHSPALLPTVHLRCVSAEAQAELDAQPHRAAESEITPDLPPEAA